MTDKTQESNTSKAIKGLSSQTIVTLVLGILEIVSFSIMSRLLTQQDFGYFAAISAVTIIFSTFSETGIGSAIIQQKELTQRYINNAFTISLIFGSIISVLLSGLAGPLAIGVADESMKVPLMLMSGTLLLNCLTSVNLGLMQRKMQFLRIGTINIISLFITTGVAIWLAYQGYGYYAIIAKAVLSSVITYILSFILCKTHFRFVLDLQTFKKIFSFSGWLMASGLFRNLAHQIDRLLMPSLLSVSALGAYNRPKDFIEQMSSKIAGIFDTVLFPVLSSIQDDLRAIRSSFCRSLHLLNTFALLFALALAVNSGLIIRIFFGNQWMDLRPVTTILSFVLLINFDGRLADCYLRSLAMTKQQFFFRILETVLNVMGVLIGYRWGIMGVACCIVLTNAISKFLKIFFVGTRIDVYPRRTIQIILSSWRYSLIVLPLYVAGYLLLPNTWGGDLVLAGIFVLTIAVLFIFMPKIVSQEYYNEVYLKMVTAIKQKIWKK